MRYLQLPINILRTSARRLHYRQAPSRTTSALFLAPSPQVRIRTMSSSTTPSSTATPPNQNTTTPDQQETTPSSSSNHQPLPLPEPPAAGQDGDGSSAARQLEVGGEGLKLDHLGPLVVHQDGTMSRIGNWGEMSEFERENTLRIIGKRNQQRLKKLREEGGNSAGVAAAAAATNADEPGKQQ